MTEASLIELVRRSAARVLLECISEMQFKDLKKLGADNEFIKQIHNLSVYDFNDFIRYYSGEINLNFNFGELREKFINRTIVNELIKNLIIAGASHEQLLKWFALSSPYVQRLRLRYGVSSTPGECASLDISRHDEIRAVYENVAIAFSALEYAEPRTLLEVSRRTAVSLPELSKLLFRRGNGERRDELLRQRYDSDGL
ncbi:hypothetical protein [Salmonella enterica]|uniref:hypothetical protein n=1 Tax=Salmonella enterica TaxID=28901 RepID=UPI0033162A0A